MTSAFPIGDDVLKFIKYAWYYNKYMICALVVALAILVIAALIT